MNKIFMVLILILSACTEIPQSSILLNQQISQDIARLYQVNTKPIVDAYFKVYHDKLTAKKKKLEIEGLNSAKKVFAINQSKAAAKKVINDQLFAGTMTGPVAKQMLDAIDAKVFTDIETLNAIQKFPLPTVNTLGIINGINDLYQMQKDKLEAQRSEVETKAKKNLASIAKLNDSITTLLIRLKEDQDIQNDWLDKVKGLVTAVTGIPMPNLDPIIDGLK